MNSKEVVFLSIFLVLELKIKDEVYIRYPKSYVLRFNGRTYKR